MIVIAELLISRLKRTELDMMSPQGPDFDRLRDPHDQGRAHARIDRAPAVSTVYPRNESGRGDRLRPACQAWGGPRALNRTWSNEAGSLAANDHRNTSMNELGAKMSARTGTISVLARLIFAQIAQKSPARPVGF